MIRLTLKNAQGQYVLRKLPNSVQFDPIARLAAYEDTGLDPEEIKRLTKLLEEKSENATEWAKKYFALQAEIQRKKKEEEEAAAAKLKRRSWWELIGRK